MEKTEQTNEFKLSDKALIYISQDQIRNLLETEPKFKEWVDRIIPPIGKDMGMWGIQDKESYDSDWKNIGSWWISNEKTTICHGDGFEIAAGIWLNAHFRF